MPKVQISNNRGVVQSSGNGLQLKPSHEVGAGLHFKTIEVDIGAGGHTNSGTNKFVAYTGIVLPAQSVVLGASAVVTELSNRLTATYSLSLIEAGDKTVGDSSLSETDVLTGVTTGSGVALNKGFGGLFDTPKTVGVKVNLAVVEDGSNTGGAQTSGKIVVTVVYTGVES